MTVLHGPRPGTTLDDLRQMVRDMDGLPGTSRVRVVFLTSDIKETPTVDGETYEADGFCIDAATEDSIVVWPWTPNRG